MSSAKVKDQTDNASDHDGPVVMVNVFRPKDGKLNEFVEAQTAEYERLRGKVEGWVGNRLHRSVDGKLAVNYAKFDSLESYNAWRKSDLFAEHLEKVEHLIEDASPHLFGEPVYEAGEV